MAEDASWRPSEWAGREAGEGGVESPSASLGACEKKGSPMLWSGEIIENKCCPQKPERETALNELVD